ncbi:hypothetical protein [Hyphococcus sp.]|uniref:hypothetical protein n=1 Tax=Hyphococcus sp. TaxID=2038636 RepID=UPI0035C6E9D9
MSTNPGKGDILVLVTALAILGVTPAHAYLDPGSGAAITSAILGFFAAITFTLRKYFHKLMRVFTGGPKKEKSE